MKTLEWIMDKIAWHPPILVYATMGAIVLGLAGHSGYQTWVKEKELRREFAQEAVQESAHLETSLSTPIKKYDWKPIDITERIKEGMDYFGDSVVFEPEINKRIGGILEDHASQNGNWWASMSVRRTDGGRYLSSAFLQSEFPFEYRVNTWMLFDKKNEKIYALTWDDEKKAGFPGKDFWIGGASKTYMDVSVADNGTCAYSVASREVPAKDRGRIPSYARIIADISRGKKYVMPIICSEPPFFPMVDLSEDGSHAKITGDFYGLSRGLLDLKTENVTEVEK